MSTMIQTSPQVIITQIHKGPPNAPGEWTIEGTDDALFLIPSSVRVTVNMSGMDYLVIVYAPWIGSHAIRVTGQGHFQKIETCGPTPTIVLQCAMLILYQMANF